MGSPYAHMSTPTGAHTGPPTGSGYATLPQTPKGLCTGPLRGPVKLRFSFSSRTVSLRLSGSLTTPKGGTGPLRGPVTLRLMRAHACTCTFA